MEQVGEDALTAAGSMQATAEFLQESFGKAGDPTASNSKRHPFRSSPGALSRPPRSLAPLVPPPTPLAAMVIEASLKQATLLKKVVEGMKELCKDVNFDVSEKGISVQSMDSSHVALVGLLLRESAFMEYRCDRPTSLGMNVEALSKVFRLCGPNDSLKIMHANDADQVTFQSESQEDDKISEMTLNLMDIESEQMEIPEQEYKVVARLPSSEFLKICRDLREFGETMQVNASKDGLRFAVQGDLGSGQVMLKPRATLAPGRSC